MVLIAPVPGHFLPFTWNGLTTKAASAETIDVFKSKV